MRLILCSNSTEVVNDLVCRLLNERHFQELIESKQLILTVAPDAAIGLPIRKHQFPGFREPHRDNSKKHSPGIENRTTEPVVKKHEEETQPAGEEDRYQSALDEL